MLPRLKVVVPSYNSVKWIRKTLDSVQMQTYGNFDVCVIDDASTQPGQAEIIQNYCDRYGWQAILRTQNIGALANIAAGIKQHAPQDEDVIVLIDGDDWLYHRRVFEKIAKIYASEPVLMTYGQYMTYPRWQIGLGQPLSQELLQKKNFREAEWIYAHLRTFKYKVWKNIKEEDFKDPAGHYFKTSSDVAFLFPMLEMIGGENCKFIDDILYVYNQDNPLNDCVAYALPQNTTTDYIRSMPRYSQIFHGAPLRPDTNMWMGWHQRWISIYRKLITPKAYLLAANKLLKKCGLKTQDLKTQRRRDAEKNAES